MIGKKNFAILLAAALFALSTGWSGAQAFDEVYVFGDSLSDNGNLFALTGQPPAPYFDGRFSNEVVWSERLPAKLGIVADQSANNFAYGGAMSDDMNVNGPLPGLQTEVADYLTATSNTASSTALYVVWIGANDYFDGQTDPNVVVGNTSTAISDLAAAGAVNFLVPNLPDLGNTPGGQASGQAAGLNMLAAGHNALLAAELANLRSTLSLEIYELDVNTLFVDLQANPAMFGFVDATTPCFVAPNPPCATPNDNVFWDAIHPTGAAHEELANRAASVLPGATAVENWTLYE